MDSYDPVLDQFVAVARKYWLLDDETLAHFKAMVINTPLEAREILFDPAWMVGFVAGLVYAKRRAHNIPLERGEMEVLSSIVRRTLDELQHMPYVGNKN